MQDSFPYESNGLLLSKFLVPYPISQRKWKASCKEWQGSAGKDSLLAYLIREGAIREEEYLNWMQQALGVEVYPRAEDRNCEDPEITMLRQFGFIPILTKDRGKYIAGGPDLPPSLGKYLGTRSSEWKWILTTPVVKRENTPQTLGSESGKEISPSSKTREWLEQLLLNGWAKGASDLHLELSSSELRIRMRTAQGMQDTGCWPRVNAEPAIRLLKDWSGISTAENSLPSDGRLCREINGRRHSFRISHLRTVNGESIVLRQLSSASEIPSMNELGVPRVLQEKLNDTIRWDSGLILFTGPTGSGKTTTLYGLLSSLGNSNLKILSIEDPVEYALPHVSQSTVHEQCNWTFDRAIRAFLRQDPDVLILGEMRDRPSAEVACRAALTGHSVLATLHAQSESTAIDRLTAWGIPEGIISEVVQLVVNQRLIASGNGTTRHAHFSWTSKENPKPSLDQEELIPQALSKSFEI